MKTDLTPWLGVDLDGTLAELYWPEKGAFDPERIGDPIEPMVLRVKGWLEDGLRVKILTARAAGSSLESRRAIVAIENWCFKHLGTTLEVTCVKDYGCIQLWDDRAVRVIQNTGKPCCEAP